MNLKIFFHRLVVFFCLFAFILFLPTQVWARIGVGVGLGKVEMPEILRAGGIYDLPVLPVINTGDEAMDYEVGIQFRENIPELRPEKSWFRFSPNSFHLEPGKVQLVTVRLDLPAKVEPGKYFAFLQAHPVMNTEAGKTGIGVAAAAKVYFEIKAGSWLGGAYHKVVVIYGRLMPWDNIVIGLIVLSGLIVVAKKKFKIQIARK
jgi:hypothetical protein